MYNISAVMRFISLVEIKKKNGAVLKSNINRKKKASQDLKKQFYRH